VKKNTTFLLINLKKERTGIGRRDNNIYFRTLENKNKKEKIRKTKKIVNKKVGPDMEL
jgi:hypothetical protein